MKYKLFPWLVGFLLLAVIILASFPAPVINQPDPFEQPLKTTYDAPFTLRFSHIMHRKSVEDHFMISPKIGGSFKWKDFWTLEFIPDQPLTIGDEYRVVIKGEARSIWMKQLGYETNLHYLVTGPPFVEFVHPAEEKTIGEDGAITVMFDRAMDFSGKNKTDLLRIEPALSGDIRYFGSSAFQFFPKKIEPARTYKLTVPAGLSAIDGGKMIEDYSWVIMTPDLKAHRSEPENGAGQVPLNEALRIYFDGEVPLAGIQPGINALLYPSNDLDANTERKMDGFFNTEVTYGIDETGETQKNILFFTPTFDYQPDEHYRFVLKQSDDLRLQKDFELEFSTSGKTDENIPEKTAEEAEIFSESVFPDNDPMQFFVRGENPRLHLSTPLSEPALLSVCQVSSNEYIRITKRNGWNHYECSDTSPVTLQPARLGDELTIHLNDYFKLDWVTGVYFVSLQQGKEKIIRHFLVEDTTLLLKRSDADLLVWALDTKSGRPIADMDVEVISYEGDAVTRGKTDTAGIYSLTSPLDEGIYVRVKKENKDSVSRWGFVSDRWILDETDNTAVREDKNLLTILNQDIFFPGDDIKIKGFWRESRDHVLTLPDAVQVTVSVTDLHRHSAISKHIPMRRNGSFDSNIPLPANFPSGDYLISIMDLNDQELSSPIPIQIKNRHTDLDLEWLEAKKDHSYGMAPVYIVKARYQSGLPAAGVKGSYGLYRQPADLSYQDGAIGYTFGNPDTVCREYCEEKTFITQQSFEFDRNGEARLLLTGSKNDFLLSGYDYDLKVTAALPNNDPVSLTHSFSVHQGNFNLGLGVKHAIIDLNESIEVSAFAMSHDGKMEAGRKVKLALISSDRKDKKVYENSFETGLRPNSLSIPVSPAMENGVYRLQIKSQDEKHNEISSEQLVFVNSHPLQTISDDLLLAVDQPQYFVGGRAHLLINEPNASEDSPVTVVITYERDGLLGHQTMELTSPVTRMAVPIRDAMMPHFKIILTRFNRGLSPSFTSVSRIIRVDDDRSKIFVDLSYEPLFPEPGKEITVFLKTYDYQNQPVPAVISLNLLNQNPADFPLSYSSFFSGKIRGLRNTSNISLQSLAGYLPTPFRPPFFLLNSARSVYFDPLITSNQLGEAKVTIPLPDKREDLFLQIIATKDSDQFGYASSSLRMNRNLAIRPILPGTVIPGDQTILSASVKNISDHPIQSRLEFFSPDLPPKGDVTRNFSLQPGQQTELNFSIFIDSSLTKEAIRVGFRSEDDEAESLLPLRHLKSSQSVSGVGWLEDLWAGRITFPKEAYPGLGHLDLFMGGGPLVFAESCLNALDHYIFQSNYLLAVRLILETDTDTAQNLASSLLVSADSKGAYRFWNEPSASPVLSALILLAYTEATNQGVHLDSIQINRTIDYLLNSLEQGGLNPEDELFMLWVLGKNKQLDTRRALDHFRERNEISLKGLAFLLLNLDQLVRAGQNSMSSALDTLKAELTDTVSENRNHAVLLYALSQLDSDPSLMETIVRSLVSQDSYMTGETNPEDILWTVLAFRSYSLQKNTSGINYIAQAKINGAVVLDQSVTGNSANQVFRSVFDAGKLSPEGINEIFVKKEGAGPLYFDARLTSYLDPAQVKRLERGMVMVRKFYEINDKGGVSPAIVFKKGDKYLSEIDVIVPKNYHYVALTDHFPAGMKILSGSPSLNEPFTQYQTEDDRIIYLATDLPAGVYKLRTELRATLGGNYLYLPASIQVLFEPTVMGRTEGGSIQILD